MNESSKEQMYIITAPCWKCDKTINIAVIDGDMNKRNSTLCGSEAFSPEEIKTAQNHNVLIKEQHSYTMQESYQANTYPHCNALIGQHFLFTEYFVPAVQDEDYEYKVIDIS